MYISDYITFQLSMFWGVNCICFVLCLMCIVDLMTVHAQLKYQVEILFNDYELTPSSHDALKQKIVDYMFEKDMLIYVNNVTIYSL